MKTSLVNSAKWCLGVASLCFATWSHAELLTNGDFEGGQDPWETAGNASIDLGGGRTKSSAGTYTATDDILGGSITRKVIGLTSGTNYLLDFFVKIDPSITFSFKFGNKDLKDFDYFDEPDPFKEGSGWTYYSLAFPGFEGGDLVFTFGGGTIGSPATPTSPEVFDAMALIDDVSLTCEENRSSTNLDCSNATGGGNNVPEPGSLLLIGAALAGLGLARRRKTA